AARKEHKDGDVEHRNVLLIRQVAISSQENVELADCQGEAARHCACWPTPSPARSSRRGRRARASNVWGGIRQAGRARARSASLACSKAATACSRVTVGKSSRNSDNGCPPSR